MRKKVWFWTSIEDDDAVAVYESEQAGDDHSDPRCPKCGERSVWDEGVIDQDFMGNDIRGWWYICWGCGLSTQAIEGEYNDSEF